jgi:copper(I)-binding protein
MRLPLVLAAICAALPLGGCGRDQAAELRVEDAWVRLPAAAGRPAAGYFVLRGGAAPERLATIESPQSERAELHQGGMMDGMMTMRPMNGVDLPADGRAKFAPGGDHVMLFGIDPAVRPGSTMTLRFRFQSGATREAAARVIAVGDPAPSLEHD